MTYTQTWDVIENRERRVSFYANLSDTFDGLFALDGTAVDCFEIEGWEKSLAQDGGAIESELKFKMNSETCRTGNNAAAFTFTKQAVVPANKRFFAVFIDEISTDNIAFYGVIQTEFEIQDYHWLSDEWSTTTNAFSEFSFVVKPFQKAIFEAIQMSDLLADIIADTTWITANVENKQGYFSESYHNRRVQYKNLCNFNSFIRRLADSFEAKLTELELGTISVNFNYCYLPQKFAPARFFPIRNKYKKLGRYVDPKIYTFSDDFYALAIDPERTLNQFEIFFDFSLVNPDPEAPAIGRTERVVFSKYESFNEFIEAIALTFGLYVEFKWASEVELNIYFYNNETIQGGDTYIPDVTDSKLNISAGDIDNTYIPDVDGTAFTADGSDYYRRYYMPEATEPSYAMPSGKEKAKNGDSLLSVSPSLCQFSLGHDYVYDSQRPLTGFNNEEWIENGLLRFAYDVYAPTNINFTKNGAAYDLDRTSTPEIHSGIYMYVGKYANYATQFPTWTQYDEPNGLKYDYEFEPNDFWAPAGALACKFGTEDKTFESLKEFFKYRSQYNFQYYKMERDIKIPFITKFSLASDGSDPSWKNLVLGSKIELDSVIYTVTKISVNLSDLSTSLTLVGSGAFDILNSITAGKNSIIDSGINSTNYMRALSPVQVMSYPASETITEGQIVALENDGTISLAYSNSNFTGRIFGVALNSGSAGDYIDVQFAGTYTIPNSYSDLTANSPVFCVLPLVHTGVNLTQTPISTPAENLDLHCKIGTAVSTRDINLDFSTQIILFYEA